ncbi:Hypothetical predicted protein [Octopus vulgaris]|nr:coiled-coil-helix-coiled-coil-helix domain-containing protein 7 [Octopus sinensis]UUA79746.1 coiled-coil-helix-coiled-coil-helix domain-containing protein 7 [Octopus vulgaris]CAI9732850.1 Hypothetical predicted protein [Octopus vulgaris]
MSLPKDEEKLKTEPDRLTNSNHAKKKTKGREFTRAHNEETNPCVRESLMSFKCLDDNGYVRDKCEKYFTNYRNCREFWSVIVRERKRAGITPNLPSIEDREEIRRTRFGPVL